MRVVVELRRDADPEKVLADLQRRTSLQSNFGAILLALVMGQPQQLSLRQLLQTFLEYRELTMIRRTSHALRKTEDRLEVVEGLITALDAPAGDRHDPGSEGCRLRPRQPDGASRSDRTPGRCRAGHAPAAA